ncbi:helix-turn-helix domain-containing protein [Actinomadura formosensis]|uniref:helix-turn-helix domain-containing protein n=1 Tax=Actinomadura formosensis TaxID=60706 RepID=UPI000B2FB928|nr:helix-turn-helix domain-containing protein [Actinomadura formosensis]
MDDLLGGPVRPSETDSNGAVPAVPAYRIVQYRADRADCVRTAGQARRDTRGGYRFLLPLHGELLMLQDGREARLCPRTGGLVPPAAPLRIVQRGPARALVMTIPAREVDGRLNLPSLPVTGVDLTAGLGRVVAGMVRAVGEERDTLTGPEFDAACDRITELLCLAVAGTRCPDVSGPLAEVEAVVRRYVRAHATDPGLTGTAMAQDLGWSLRQIQLALQRAGTTPRELIREERLRLVRDRLRDPLYRHVTITDLAHTTGFSSASALSHAFRQRFGVSPRELRRTGDPR